MLDLTLGLTSCLRAGSPLPHSIEIIIKDMKGPICEEFSIVLQEHQLGIPLAECLERLYIRMPNDDLKLITSAVKLTQQTGGSLAEVLEKITNTIRERTELKDKLLTLTSQGRFEAVSIALAPLATFLILCLTDPTLMAPLIYTKTGWCWISVVIILEAVGFFIINKIIAIES